MVGDFCGSLISRILDFQVSREKFSRISISDFTRGNNFSRISCTVFESNKHGSHLVVFVTLFATNFIEVQQCKKARSKFLRDFCWREFVSRDLIITNQRKVREIRDN